jgi:hypothetical protein
MAERARQAALFTANFLRIRVNIYSPIVHCHALAIEHDLPKDFQFWQDYNFSILAKASQLWVLTLDGWDVSKGVLAEIELANMLSIPIERVHLTE